MSQNRKKRQYPKIKIEVPEESINFSFYAQNNLEIQKLHDRINQKPTN